MDEAVTLLKAGAARPGSLIAYGNGRSYGDSCQNADGTVIDMRRMNRILGFDPETGLLEAEAGTLLAKTSSRTPRPMGYSPAVVPGTQFVTLGGAITNDVHSKTITAAAASAATWRASRCAPTGACCAARRARTCAISGRRWADVSLTGLILTATMRLMRVPSLDVVQTTTRLRGLAEYFELAEATDASNEYAVAWIDQLASSRIGRAGGCCSPATMPSMARMAQAQPAADCRCPSSRQ